MNDFLGRLAARALGEAPVVKPRVRSRYEPGGVPQAGEAWGEEVVEAVDRKDGRDNGDSRDREGRREEAGEAAPLEAPGERRPAPRAPVPVSQGFEPRAAEPLATRPIPEPPRAAPVGEPVEVADRPLPAPAAEATPPKPGKAVRKAPPRPAPVAAPEPPPRHGEPRIWRPATIAEPAEPPSREPAPRRERRGGEPPPVPAVPSPSPAPAPVEARPAIRVSRPAQQRTEPLPTVGPRRGAPDLVPSSERGGEPAAPEEVVRVSIGRIDVHAGPPATPAPVPRRPAGSRLSLSDYLKGRNERRRR
jgi:hypothetical protein